MDQRIRDIKLRARPARPSDSASTSSDSGSARSDGSSARASPSATSGSSASLPSAGYFELDLPFTSFQSSNAVTQQEEENAFQHVRFYIDPSGQTQSQVLDGNLSGNRVAATVSANPDGTVSVEYSAAGVPYGARILAARDETTMAHRHQQGADSARARVLVLVAAPRAGCAFSQMRASRARMEEASEW